MTDRSIVPPGATLVGRLKAVEDAPIKSPPEKTSLYEVVQVRQIKYIDLTENKINDSSLSRCSVYKKNSHVNIILIIIFN